MKKVFIVSILIGVAGSALADPAPPSWGEFCPSQYANASRVTVPPYKFPLHFMAGVLTLGISDVVVSSPARNRYREAVTNNYWADRRSAFVSELQTCDSSTGDKALCYTQVRQLEAQKNAAHVQEAQLEALRRQVTASRAVSRPAPTYHCNGSTCYPY